MSTIPRWTLGGGIAALLVCVPFVYYRWAFTQSKRLRDVVPGLVYRSGQMTRIGFTDAVARYHLKTIINLQDDVPDPAIQSSFLNRSTTAEDRLCQELNVHYVFISTDLILRRLIPAERPRAIDQFLAIMDDPDTYPVLIHCRAGLHRTGLMTAIYRMEYQGWTQSQALQELKANGFSDFACSSANDYITQYILTYRPGIRR